MSAPVRPHGRVLAENLGLLTLRSTDALYAEQDELWAMGERGRQHTFEDFGHHYRVLSALDVDLFARHVLYCRDLFTKRSFPQRWLDDAWRVMAATLVTELPSGLAKAAVHTLTAGVERAESGP